MLLRIWNGKQIRHREDGFLSLTDMAYSCGKKYADWARLDSTKTYLKTLSSVMRFPITGNKSGWNSSFTGNLGTSESSYQICSMV